MERLTQRETGTLGNGEEIVVCKHQEEDCNDSCMYGRCKWNKKALDKLKAYEDAEEQGLLLKLPCKVGDKAYYVHQGVIDEVEVDSFVLNVNLFVNVSLYIGCDRFGKTLTPYKTLFFTLEEAKAMLAEMRDKE